MNVMVGGCPRSGTSCITDALSRCGLDLGQRLSKIRRKSTHQRLATEDPVFVAANTQVFETADCDRRRAESFFDSKIQREGVDRVFDDKTDPWVLKDPIGVSLLYPLWRKVLNERGIKFRAVFVLRHPSSVISSGSSFFSIRPDRMAKIWWQTYQSLLTWTTLYPDDFRWVLFPQLLGMETATLDSPEPIKWRESYNHNFVRTPIRDLPGKFHQLTRLYEYLENKCVT